MVSDRGVERLVLAWHWDEQSAQHSNNCLAEDFSGAFSMAAAAGFWLES